jgi:hypothetical protein
MSSVPIDVQRRFEQRWACRFNRSPAPKQAGQTVVQLADGADGKPASTKYSLPITAAYPWEPNGRSLSAGRAAGLGDGMKEAAK